MNNDDKYVDDRLKNTTRINPIDQFLLKYHDCKRWEKAFLTATEGSLCRYRMRLLNALAMHVCEDVKHVHEDDDIYEEFNPSSFLKSYKLAKATVENAKKVDVSQELQDLKKSPDRMAALKKAIDDRVYPPEIADPLMLNPLYRSVTSPDFINEFEFNGHFGKALIHYRSEYGCGEVTSSVEEIVEMFESDKKEEENK